MCAARTSEGSAIPDRRGHPLEALFAGAFGLFLGLALLKFGNPVILEKEIEFPTDIYQWVLTPWPPVIGYWLLAGVVLLGLIMVRGRAGIPWRIAFLPAAWLAWEILSGTQSVDARLSHATLIHFTTCVVCFYLGLLALGGTRSLWPFWTGLLAGFLFVLWSGFEQHFGGLEQTRRYYYLYVYPNLKEPPPAELIKRMSTNRIFATLFYPNALAGVILLLLPPLLAFVGTLKTQMTASARRFSVALIAAAALACLYWSGSKGGWLLFLVTGLVALLFLPVKRQWKMALVSAALVLGLAGFVVRYAGFFQKGATSVVARFEYWHGAATAINERPLLGSGPGTFGVVYQRLKKPESEMSRLVHNDYLQQASDSGVPGSLLYTAFLAGVITWCGRADRLRDNWLQLGVWLGLLAWALQSLVEFGLYIPAIAWPAFTFMGWLLAQNANPSTDSPKLGNNETAK